MQFLIVYGHEDNDTDLFTNDIDLVSYAYNKTTSKH